MRKSTLLGGALLIMLLGPIAALQAQTQFGVNVNVDCDDAELFVFSDDIAWYVVEGDAGQLIASAALMHQTGRRQDARASCSSRPCAE